MAKIGPESGFPSFSFFSFHTPSAKLWYNLQTKLIGLGGWNLACTFLKAFPMEVFSKILKILIFSPKNCVFCEFGLRKISATRRKTLVQHPGQTIRPTTIKIGMHLPDAIPYGGFFENFKNSNFFSWKLRFCEFGLRKNTASIQHTLVQPTDQTNRPRWMKFGMRIPKGIPYGGFLENFKNLSFFPQKLRFF